MHVGKSMHRWRAGEPWNDIRRSRHWCTTNGNHGVARSSSAYFVFFPSCWSRFLTLITHQCCRVNSLLYFYLTFRTLWTDHCYVYWQWRAKKRWRYLAWTTCNCYTHTHTHPFNGPLSGTTRVSRYQKGKTNLDFTEARDSEWQWNPQGHMQVCTSLQTDNHASTPPLSFLQAGCPSCRPTNSVKALKELLDSFLINFWRTQLPTFAGIQLCEHVPFLVPLCSEHTGPADL